MGHTYAGILGLLAFTTVILRSALKGGGVDATIQAACLSLFVFAGVGFVIGRIADWTVTDAVHRKFRDQLQTQPGSSSSGEPAA